MAEPLTVEPELTTAQLAGIATPPPPSPEHADARPSPLFVGEETAELRKRWMEIQTGFVDDPRASVQHADSLVAGTMKRLAEIFASERSGLEKQWDKGEEVSTEDLRQAMRRYRSFFDRLLSI